MKMSKTTAFIICVLLVLSSLLVNVFAAEKPYEMQSIGQIHFDVYKTDKPPVIDGIVSEDEYGYTLYDYKYGSPGTYWQMDKISANGAYGESAIPEYCVAYMTYDDTYLYVGLVVKDYSHKSYDNWDGDYLEFDFSTNFGDDFMDMSDRTRIANGINGEDGKESEFDNYFSYAAEGSFTGSSDHKYEYKTVRDKANNTTTYELKIDWQSHFGTNGAPAKSYMMYQLGIGDLSIESPDGYKAYIACFRLAADARDQTSGSTDKYGRECIYHVMNFTGEYPPVVVEEVEFAAVEVSGEAVVAVTSAQTGDITAAFTAIIVISFLGTVLIRRKTRSGR